MAWHRMSDNKEEDDVKSAISKHQADLLVPPDISKYMCTVIQFSCTIPPKEEPNLTWKVQITAIWLNAVALK